MASQIAQTLRLQAKESAEQMLLPRGNLLPVLGCIALFLGQKGRVEWWVVLVTPPPFPVGPASYLGLPFWTAPHGHVCPALCFLLT